jgi:NAD(P)-dependent dehydrogenase (short-subunit alcohol dehydrogenase family)
MSDKRLGVLTGAAGHIGRAAVEKFASNGWSLVIADMSDAVFSVAEDAARKHGIAVVGVRANVAEEGDAARVAAAVDSSQLPMKFLGLIAGINHDAAAVDLIDMDVWGPGHVGQLAVKRTDDEALHSTPVQIRGRVYRNDLELVGAGRTFLFQRLLRLKGGRHCVDSMRGWGTRA